MSAPSSNAPNGQRQGPAPAANSRQKPTANPLRPIVRRRPANPLATPKRAPSSKPFNPPASASAGVKVDYEAGAAAKLERLRSQYGGWSEPPPKAEYRDIPIVTTAKALREGTRYHIMRFPQSMGARDRGAVDPTDQNVFTRPVLLHRRDPRQPPPGHKDKNQKSPSEGDETADDKEAERLHQMKAEREAQKAADQAKIAPTVKEMNSKRPRKPREDQVISNRMPKTEKGRKEAGLRYEEALPWHLEDVDGKNVLAGRYIAALSEANVALVFDGSRYRMIPVEKWYRFTAKPPYQQDGEGDEETKEGAKKTKEVPLAGWMTRASEKRAEETNLKKEFRSSGKRLGPARAPLYANDVRGDEIDMEGDEFDDDDENMGFDNDEDTKISNARIRQEQLGANLFGDADEKEVDAEEQRKLRQELERKLASKKLKKTLKKRENVDDVESDESGSDDPFAETSSDEDEEEEEEESQAKTEEDEKAKNEKDKVASGTAQKGSTTPSGRKQADMTKKVKNLKRPGSPTLSESSGNESALRKKAKKKAGSTAIPSRSTTPMPQGQGVPGQAGQRRKMAGGSASDGEATGGEMSDSQPRKKKIKLIPSSTKGTPAGSRAGSPLPAPASGSPGASPTKDGQASPKPAIEAWEIVQALPQLPDGISIQNFLKLFEGRVGEKAEAGRMAKSEWIRMVRENCSYGSDKLLRRKS